MPIDINLLRVDRGGDPEKVRESQRRRYDSVELVDEIIEMDNRWRKLTAQIDDLKKEKNAIQKQVGMKMKAKEKCDDMIAQVKALGEEAVKVEETQQSTYLILCSAKQSTKLAKGCHISSIVAWL